MLRPATPLTICFFIAFVLLLLSVLSTPIIRQVPLASFKGVEFGVFGYCRPDACSGFTVGYKTDTLFSQPTNDNGDWSLPPSTRTSLSSILIVHPVAALLALICTGMAAASHFHAPSHSPRYLLALLLLTFPTLLVSLLAFLVDILLFIPHMAWGGWIVLAATIVITVGIVMTCAMRRTLVSRRARKNRIYEHAEMNGDNFYANRSAPSGPMPGVIEPLPKAESPPPLSTGRTLVNSDKGAEFATFELQQKRSDDRQPLNPTRSNSSGDESNRYYGADPGAPGPAGRGRPPPRDQFGNPLPPGAYGQPLRHQGSNGTVGSQGSRGPPPPGWFRGRGAPRGGPRGGPHRGVYGPKGGFRGGPQGMRGPPPPGWNGGRGGMGPGMAMGRGHRGPPPVYENDQQYGGPPQQGREVSPGAYGARDVSPARDYYEDGPIGQAIEMDAVNGVVPPRSPHSPNYGLRDSDGDVQGMIGLQQQRIGHDISPQNVASPTSEYSARNSEYVPPRSGWQNQQAPPMPQHTNSSGTLPNSSRGLSPIQASPVELPAHLANSPAFPNQPPSPTHGRKASTDYYEDVDPRYAAQSDPTSPPPTAGVASSAALPSAMPLPSALVAGGYHNQQTLSPQNGQLDPSSSYEELAEGARSPAASDTSHFTSVSQRPVNPNWRPQPGNEGQFGPGYGGPRKQAPNAVLDGNPDFGLPGVGPPGRARGRGRGGSGGAQMGAPQLPPVNMTGVGRYPGPDAI